MNIDEVKIGSDSELTLTTLESYLANLTPNTPSSPHNIALKVSSVDEFPTIRTLLDGAPNKYVNLDLTGSTVTSIGKLAFVKCTSLASITIPNSVTSIGEGAFYSCENLVSIIIPDSVTSIGESAFHFCESLTSVTIGIGVTRIEFQAFSCCTSLISITIPDSVISIGNYVFSNCASLTSVIIGSGVISIERGAFAYCDNLTSVTFKGAIPSSGFRSFTSGLRDKFYATDKANGTPGTYTTPNPGWDPTWTLQ
jgi:hypothetical protein